MSSIPAAAAEVLRFVAEDLVMQSRAPLGTDLTNAIGVRLEITEETRDQMRDLAGELWEKLGVQHCSSCACTEKMACEGGCSWASPNKCSACVERSITEAPQRRKRILRARR